MHIVIGQSEADKLIGELIVSNLRHSGNNVEMRIISEEKPFEGAIQTEPCLEDLYLYYFKEESINELNEI